MSWRNSKLWDSSAQKFWYCICYISTYKGQLFWTSCRGSYIADEVRSDIAEAKFSLTMPKACDPWHIVTFNLFFRWAVKPCDSWEYRFFFFTFRGLFKMFSAIWDNGKVISFSQCKTFGVWKTKKKKTPCDLFQSTFLSEFNSLWERQGESSASNWYFLR